MCLLLHESMPTNYALVHEAYTVQMHIPSIIILHVVYCTMATIQFTSLLSSPSILSSPHPLLPPSSPPLLSSLPPLPHPPVPPLFPPPFLPLPLHSLLPASHSSHVKRYFATGESVSAEERVRKDPGDTAAWLELAQKAVGRGKALSYLELGLQVNSTSEVLYT